MQVHIGYHHMQLHIHHLYDLVYGIFVSIVIDIHLTSMMKNLLVAIGFIQLNFKISVTGYNQVCFISFFTHFLISLTDFYFFYFNYLKGWFILVQAMASIAFTFSCLSLLSLSIVLMYFLVRHQVIVIIVAFVFQILAGKFSYFIHCTKSMTHFYSLAYFYLFLLYFLQPFRCWLRSSSLVLWHLIDHGSYIQVLTIWTGLTSLQLLLLSSVPCPVFFYFRKQDLPEKGLNECTIWFITCNQGPESLFHVLLFLSTSMTAACISYFQITFYLHDTHSLLLKVLHDFTQSILTQLSCNHRNPSTNGSRAFLTPEGKPLQQQQQPLSHHHRPPSTQTPYFTTV